MITLDIVREDWNTVYTFCSIADKPTFTSLQFTNVFYWLFASNGFWFRFTNFWHNFLDILVNIGCALLQFNNFNFTPVMKFLITKLCNKFYYFKSPSDHETTVYKTNPWTNLKLTNVKMILSRMNFYHNMTSPSNFLLAKFTLSK